MSVNTFPLEVLDFGDSLSGILHNTKVHYTVIKNNKTKDLENAHATILLDRKSPT